MFDSIKTFLSNNENINKIELLANDGGIFVQNRWLRLLGNGHPEFKRSLKSWNAFVKSNDYYLLADDVLGGSFGIHFETGRIHYFAPDTLEWENLEFREDEFYQWICSGDMDSFYELYHWDNWESDIQKVSGDEGIIKSSKKIIPIKEIWLNNKK